MPRTRCGGSVPTLKRLLLPHIYSFPSPLRAPPNLPQTLDLSSPPLMASPLSSVSLLLLLVLLHACLAASSAATAAGAVVPAPKSKRSLIDDREESGKTQNRAALRKKPILGSKNQTKLVKPKKSNSTAAAGSSKMMNATAIAGKIKLGKGLNATALKSSNSTKLLKSGKLGKSNSTKSSKDQLKSLNSASNSTKSAKKSGFDSAIPKNKTASAASKRPPKEHQPAKSPPEKKLAKAKVKAKAADEATAFLEAEDDMDGTDLISDFRELPARLLPDLERLSTTSKAYISAANKGIAEGVKPYVGKSFAPKVAPVLSSLFLALPLLLLTLLFRRLRAYLSLHHLLLFIQAYLAIYFGTLALTALATGLEPLRFFYATSPGSYTWTQAAQTMGYLIYLVLQLADLVTVFSIDKDAAAAGGGSGVSSRALALTQMVIGLAVGVHYYAAVFHRAVTGEPPRANWRVHGVYAACFLVICACARAERRKKAYYDEGGDDGKNS